MAALVQLILLEALTLLKTMQVLPAPSLVISKVMVCKTDCSSTVDRSHAFRCLERCMVPLAASAITATHWQGTAFRKFGGFESLLADQRQNESGSLLSH